MICTVADLVAGRSSAVRARTAAVDGAASISYQDLAGLAGGYAALLADKNVAPGDRVALLVPRSVNALAAFFGIQFLGAVAVFLSDRLSSSQVAHILADSGATAVFATDRGRPLLREARLAPERILDVDAKVIPCRPSSPIRVIGKDLAMLTYTSGSTGRPKGVMLTHEALIAGAAIVSDYLALTADDRVLAVLPWSFDYGLSQVLSTMYAGGAIVIQRSAYPPDICRTLGGAGVTGLAGVPSLWALMGQRQSPFLRTELPSLRYLTNSGGTLAPGFIKAVRAHFPAVAIYAMYGLTEAFRSTYLPPKLIDKLPTSIGIPIPNTQILVLADDGHLCAPGEVGELVHRGPTVALGYWRNPEATAEVFRPCPARTGEGAGYDTVVYSGDYVYRDAEGFLYYVGRRDEMFKTSAGIRVNPEEIERELMRSGVLADAVVLSVRYRGADQTIVAAVVFADDGPPDAEGLAAYCRRELPQHLRPVRIIPVQDLPRTANGKTDRFALRARLNQDESLDDNAPPRLAMAPGPGDLNAPAADG